MTTAGGLVELAFPFARFEHDVILKGRILALLGTDQPFPQWWGPARWTWTNVRKRLGGRVRSAHFRRLIDELKAEGQVVEIHEAARGWGWRQHRHLLIRADRIGEVAFGRLIRVSGRKDVVDRLGPGVKEPDLGLESDGSG